MQLLESLPLGDRIAPNRVLFGPHETNLAWGRQLSDRHRAYYQERAAGGCGLLVVEEASVHASDWPYERCPRAQEASPGWTAIAAACQPHGTLVLAGLGHSGGQGSSAFSQRELWAPSDEPDVNTREVPKVMEDEDIEAVVEGFRAAGRGAMESGLDGVEVNAGQHSLIRQFLSGLTNRRSDDHGVDRVRFGREVLTATRSGMGHGGILGLRLCCDELAPWAGLTPESALDVARQLVGLVDYLVVVRGSIFTVAETRPTGHHGSGFNLELARVIRAGIETQVPVFAQGSIVDAKSGSEAVESGACDGVEMTRALIADPELVHKLEKGRTPRPCLLCNQRCRVRDNRNPIVSCVVEPRAGYETVDEQEDGTAPEPTNLLVVGAGPAGLEAARVAAGRGHRVTLVDNADETGGLLRVIAAAPGHERFALLADWLHDEVARQGVELQLGTVADIAMIEGWPGPVILATGAKRGENTWAETDPDAVVVDANEVLRTARTGGHDHFPLPQSVLVWDPVGNAVAVGVAELLAHSGRSVTFLTPDPIAATLLSLTGDLAGANVRLQQAGVTIERRRRLVAVGSRSVTTVHVYTEATAEIATEAVVDCGPRLANDELWLGSDGSPVRVGDAIAARTVGEAIREGRLAALALDPAPAAPAVVDR